MSLEWLAAAVSSLALVFGAMVVPAAAATSALDDVAYEASKPDKYQSFVTTSLQEAEAARADGFSVIRPVFMVSTTPKSGLVPVYRADRRTGTNFTSLLTLSSGERTKAISKNGYIDKGIAFYAQATSAGGAAAVPRFQRSNYNFRYVSTAEHRQALIAAGYVQQGDEFYARAPAVPLSAPPGDVAPVTDGTFSLAIYPDTQQEVFGWSGDQFAERTKWTVGQRAARDIRFVANTGDMVTSGGNATVDSPAQFVVASNAFRALDNAGLPYLTTIGNHDTKAVCGAGSACNPAYTDSWVRDTTVFNRYFSPARQQLPSSQLFEAGKVDNAYKTFSAEGRQWLVLTLELWPRAEAVNWAKGVVASHPKHNVIVLSHSLLNADGSIKAGADYGTGAKGPQYVYDNLILAYPNIRLSFSGHTGQAAKRVDTGVHGNRVVTFIGAFHSNDYNPTRIVTIDTVNNTVTSDIKAASIRDAYKEAHPNATLPTYDEYDATYGGMNFVSP